MVAVGISVLTGVDSKRFGQVHTVLYSVGIGLFTILFIIEKFSGTFSKLMGKMCCCCLNKDAAVAVFSNDLYNDINIEGQRKEYEEAKRLHNKVKTSVRKDPYNEYSALRQYYQTRILLKIKQIKYNLVCALSMAQTQNETRAPMHDTKNAFYRLEKSEQEFGSESTGQRTLHVERMRGLYSYNVLDSPEYI